MAVLLVIKYQRNGNFLLIQILKYQNNVVMCLKKDPLGNLIKKVIKKQL